MEVVRTLHNGGESNNADGSGRNLPDQMRTVMVKHNKQHVGRHPSLRVVVKLLETFLY